MRCMFGPDRVQVSNIWPNLSTSDERWRWTEMVLTKMSEKNMKQSLKVTYSAPLNRLGYVYGLCKICSHFFLSEKLKSLKSTSRACCSTNKNTAFFKNLLAFYLKQEWQSGKACGKGQQVGTWACGGSVDDWGLHHALHLCATFTMLWTLSTWTENGPKPFPKCSIYFNANKNWQGKISPAHGIINQTNFRLTPQMTNIHSHCASFLRQHGGPSKPFFLFYLNPVAGGWSICHFLIFFLQQHRYVSFLQLG